MDGGCACLEFMPSESSALIVEMRQGPEASTHAHRVAEFSKDVTREMSNMLNAVGVASSPEGTHRTCLGKVVHWLSYQQSTV